MASHWNLSGIENCDIESGSEIYFDGNLVGYTQGEGKLAYTPTFIELFQGQPQTLVGRRVARGEMVLSLPCLEFTPDLMHIATVNGSLVETSEAQPRENTESRRLDETAWLEKDSITQSSIVVKSADNSVTYVATDDYTISTDGNRVGIARVASGSIGETDEVNISYTYTNYNYTPYIFIGAANASVEVNNIVIHKYNPGAPEKAHTIIQCWKGVSQGSFEFTFNEDSTSWMKLNVEVGIISDAKNTEARHNLCPLAMITKDDSFDINNLPEVPNNL